MLPMLWLKGPPLLSLPSSLSQMVSASPGCAVMTNPTDSGFTSAHSIVSGENSQTHAWRHLRVLFVGSERVSVDLCVEALEKAEYIVDSVAVLTLADCTDFLHSQSIDFVVAEYPSMHWEGLQDLKLLHQTMQGIPLLFLVPKGGSESAAELTANGTFDELERAHVNQLPMLVRRILTEKRLRNELEEAGKALEHSQSQNRALGDKPAYGILRCDAEGRFLNVNDALLVMLGYASKDELLAASRSSDAFFDLGLGTPSGTSPAERARIEPLEVEWKRKNGTRLRVKLC